MIYSDAPLGLVRAKKFLPIQTVMCIVGASYGGYAAMMAAVKTPDFISMRREFCWRKWI